MCTSRPGRNRPDRRLVGAEQRYFFIGRDVTDLKETETTAPPERTEVYDIAESAVIDVGDGSGPSLHSSLWQEHGWPRDPPQACLA
jgi:hypothetical protein